MGLNLTPIDVKILKFIYFNGANFPEKEIARRLRLNQSTINYSIKKMERNKAILGYKYRINPEKVGLKGHAWFFFNFRNDLIDNEEVFKRVMKYPEVHVASVVTGAYDVALKIYSKNVNETNRFVVKLEKDCSDILQSTLVLYSTENHKAYNINFPKDETEYKLEPIDCKLLDFKMKNPGADLNKVADELSLHRNTVSRHWNDLWANHVLLKKTPEINPEFYPVVDTNLKTIVLFDIKKEKHGELVTELSKLDETHDLISLLTHHDLLGVFRTKDVAQFYEFLRKIYYKLECGKAIKDTHSLVILKSIAHSPQDFLSNLQKLGMHS